MLITQISGNNKAQSLLLQRGTQSAGKQYVVDIRQASGLDDLDLVEKFMRDAIAASGATLLHLHLHHFTPFGGVSGVAVLAESHLAIHTWPERSYAAIDMFVCGDADPSRMIPVLHEAFSPGEIDVVELYRGQEGKTGDAQ